jgi:hypothetical protein
MLGFNFDSELSQRRLSTRRALLNHALTVRSTAAKVDGVDVPLFFGTGDSPAVVLRRRTLPKP